MKLLNQLLKLPVLRYDNQEWYGNFKTLQLEKLFEEMQEFKKEDDILNKACEYLDMLQVVLSFSDMFSNDVLDQACRFNNEKHQKRKKFDIIGKYEIFKILNKK